MHLGKNAMKNDCNAVLFLVWLFAPEVLNTHWLLGRTACWDLCTIWSGGVMTRTVCQPLRLWTSCSWKANRCRCLCWMMIWHRRVVSWLIYHLAHSWYDIQMSIVIRQCLWWLQLSICISHKMDCAIWSGSTHSSKFTIGVACISWTIKNGAVFTVTVLEPVRLAGRYGRIMPQQPGTNSWFRLWSGTNAMSTVSPIRSNLI